MLRHVDTNSVSPICAGPAIGLIGCGKGARQPGRMRALTVVGCEMLRARRLLVSFVRARG